MIKSVYTKPKLCKAKRGWYVYFRYNNRLKRYKLGINYVKNTQERERQGNAIARVLYDKLQNGWNPFDETPQEEELFFDDAIDFALEKKKPNLAKKTYLGYKSAMGFIKEAAKDLKYNYTYVPDIKRKHIRLILEKAKTNNKWSNKSFNKYLNYLKAVLSELVNWDIIDFNPAYKIKSLPVIKTEANVVATPEQHKVIKECLQSNYPNFYIYVLVIYHCGIRPKEILDIKINDVDLVKQQIILKAENTKTNKTRIVPINNHLLEYFESMELHIYPKDFYLFGSYREPGKGNVGKYIDFIPAPTRIKRDTATKKWNRIVKKGLGIDVNLYSNKHKGANDKILAGVSLDSLRELYGHTSEFTTLIYAKKIKEVYRNEIIDKSPDY